jgi:flagellin-like hook-associated protein FlgL
MGRRAGKEESFQNQPLERSHIMSIGDIALTSGMRNNLISLQQTATLLDRTQERLSTLKKVNSAVDNPTNFFAARGHETRANLLNGLKDNISETIQMIKSADAGVKAITSTIEQLRGVITQARSALNDTVNSGTLLSGYTNQYNELIRQLNNFAGDSSYKGVNFLSGASTTVNLNENAATSIVINGFNASASGLNLSGGVAGVNSAGTLASADLDSVSELNAIEDRLNAALATLQTESSRLASNLGVLTTRNTYLSEMINTLVTGASKLTAADTNEEGANMLALQTRQQLGVTALSLSSQSLQSVLRLF